MSCSISSSGSEPVLPDDSRGSSVSSRMQEEYDELLKYAVVMPKFDPQTAALTVADNRDFFTAPPQPQDIPLPSSHGSSRQQSRGGSQAASQAGGSRDLSREPSRGGSREGSARSRDHRPESLRDSDSDSGTVSPGVGDISSAEDLQASIQKLKEKFRVSTPNAEEEEEDREMREIENERGAILDRAIASLGGTAQQTKTSYVHVVTSGQQPPLASFAPPGPMSQSNGSEESREYVSVIDPDVSKMEHMLDQWCFDLKRNVIAEFSQAKIRIMEGSRRDLQREKEKWYSERNQLMNEMASLKELLHSFEVSISRKDEVINNMTSGLNKQREKTELTRKFSDWKVSHNDKKREAFALKLATRHHEQLLKQRVWRGWHGVVENKWRARVEKACQARAQEVCLQMAADHDAKLASVNEALEAAREEVAKLHEERDRYEETMKKAFMRGVCALNMEAMSMFQQGGEQPDGGTGQQATGTGGVGLDTEFSDRPYTLAQEPVFTSAGVNVSGHSATSGLSQALSGSHHSQQAEAEAFAPRVVSTSGGAVAQSNTLGVKASTVGRGSKGKTVQAKLSATDTGRHLASRTGTKTLNPPMSSVVVERHTPIVKETLGKAKAAQFPRGVHRKGAGDGPVRVTPGIHKVVD